MYGERGAGPISGNVESGKGIADLFVTQLSWLSTGLEKLDFASILIGLLLGCLLTLLGQRARPRFNRIWQRTRRWSGQRLAGLRSEAEARFLQATAVYTQSFHLGHAWANLADVFVPPVLYVPTPEFDPFARTDWGPAMLPYLWPDVAAALAGPLPPVITVRQLLLNGRLVLLVAPEGAGKTTLLAHIAYRCATAVPGGDDDFLVGSLPALVHLDELPLNGEPLAEITAVLQKRSNPLTGAGLKRLLDLKAKTGQLLLLLDGWDTSDAMRQTAVAGWLQQLLDSYPNVRVFAAARPGGYGALVTLGFTWTGLGPWQRAQVEQLANAWARRLALDYTPKPATFWRAGLSALETSLSLWHVAGRASERPAAPPSRLSDLLTAMLPVLAMASDRLRPNHTAVLPPLDPPLHLLWSALAWRMAQTGRLSLSKEELAATIAAVKEPEGGPGRGWLQNVTPGSLFIVRAGEGVSFLSPVWRDYLAALYLACHLPAEEGAAQAMAHLTDPHWAGVLRFYVGQQGATTLAAALLAEKDTSLTRDRLFQVASWLPEAPDSGEWRRQILILLGQISRQATFPQVLRQRAMAGLVQTGESGVFQFVQQLLERSDVFLRQAGTAALPLLGMRRALPLLLSLLKDPDERVRVTAVYALFALNHPDVEQTLLAALIGEDEVVSWAAARGFAAQGAAGWEILQEALADDDVRVRRAAIQGLLSLDAPWVEPLLLRVERQDKEWLVRSAATVALEERRGRDQTNPWLMTRPEKQPWLVDYVAQSGRPLPKRGALLPFLVQLLTESERPALRVAAAMTLGQLFALETVPALEIASRDTDRQVREAAFTALTLIQRAFPT
jgi:HEAT repeat protein